MVSQIVITLLVVLVAAQRLGELAHSRRNEARLRAAGGREHARWQVPVLALLHAAWLACIVLEVWIREPAVQPGLAIPAGATFVLGQILRLRAIRTLGHRWTVGIWTLPGIRRVRRGLYASLPHPNYLGVTLEIAALPMIHGAIVTAVVFSGLNAVVLAVRIRAESRALAAAAA